MNPLTTTVHMREARYSCWRALSCGLPTPKVHTQWCSYTKKTFKRMRPLTEMTGAPGLGSVTASNLLNEVKEFNTQLYLLQGCHGLLMCAPEMSKFLKQQQHTHMAEGSIREPTDKMKRDRGTNKTGQSCVVIRALAESHAEHNDAQGSCRTHCTKPTTNTACRHAWYKTMVPAHRRWLLFRGHLEAETTPATAKKWLHDSKNLEQNA